VCGHIVAVCCSALQCDAVCCSVLQHRALVQHSSRLGLCVATLLQYIAVRCSVLQRVAVCCSELQHGVCVAVCCSDLQCVSVCCSVLLCVVACGHTECLWVLLHVSACAASPQHKRALHFRKRPVNLRKRALHLRQRDLINSKALPTERQLFINTWCNT